MQHNQPADVTIETSGVIPIMTGLLIFCMVVVFAMMCQNRMEFWMTHPSLESWTQNNASVNPVAIMTMIRDQNFTKAISTIALASLASLTGWQLALNAYFTWVFGSTVEQKLGASRFLILCALAIIIPYAIVAWDGFNHADSVSYYYGPVYVILALYGAGLVFPEEKKVRQWFRKTRGEIFQRAPRGDSASKFKVNTGLLSAVFIVYEVGLWYFADKYTPTFQTFHLWGITSAIMIGYGLTWFLVWSATGDLREGPVKLMCIRKYNEILKLDIGHEAAVRTTAMALGLPEDRVKQWVAKQKGKMKIS
ncbi:MAG: hypothetical protein K2X93_21470 [Candidatus Obscuribacterales bacterium]|nr:hypothetical protein [Candidatus Obscuribacterales bacterium]